MSRLHARVALVAGVVLCSGCSASLGAGSLEASRYVRGARQIAVEADAAVAQKQLRVTRESVECDNGSVILNATLYATPAGTPRKYLLDGGSSDSSESLAYYYDAAGKLRLVDSEQRAANGAHRTSHLYYNAKGKLVYKDEKPRGPGWTFSDPSEVFDPASNMRSLVDPDHDCRRVRPVR